MSELIIIGDIGLVRNDFNKSLKVSEELLRKFSNTITVANLEALVTDNGLNESLDIMQFVQSSKSLESMAFINALVLSAAAHTFDSYYEETIDGESNSVSV